jgi:hypothetical protein
MSTMRKARDARVWRLDSDRNPKVRLYVERTDSQHESAGCLWASRAIPPRLVHGRQVVAA